MHGLVLLDTKKNLVRPALIWADQRSADVLSELNKRIDSSLLAQCGTAPVTGFLITSLFWLQQFEPETLDRAASLLMPKDFVRFKLTGELGTDVSDASGSGIFNVRRRGVGG
jgi:xylulokinase